MLWFTAKSSGLLLQERAQVLKKGLRSPGVSRTHIHKREAFCFISKRNKMQSLCCKLLYLASAGCRVRSGWFLTRSRIWMSVLKRTWTFYSHFDRLIPTKKLNFFYSFWSASLNWNIFREQEKHTYIQLSWGSTFRSPPGVSGHIWAFLFLIHRVMGLRSSPHVPGFTPPKAAVTGDPPAVECVASDEGLKGCMPGPWERRWLGWTCSAFGPNELVSTV